MGKQPVAPVLFHVHQQQKEYKEERRKRKLLLVASIFNFCFEFSLSRSFSILPSKFGAGKHDVL